MGKGYYKKFMLIGPGGTKCKCCFPQSGTKAAAKCRHRLFRIGTKRFNRFISQIERVDHAPMPTSSIPQAA